MSNFKIKPKANILVRDPVTREPLKSTGETKPRDTYWLRRLKDKDVVEMKTVKKKDAEL